ncbi:hypothetical protein JXZ92_01775 [Mycoplasma sp. CSL10137]|uniref:hypothetical protein n=1 Tax=Mycoplasma sp. CSL10137 TaxID=2813824 RepID=UPI00197C1E05|nr:hypothetical protein [Mycoplasma sp. CSL10137]MBN4083548.1 hypothetical protein [Mycoplasma sp. CSL10137]
MNFDLKSKITPYSEFVIQKGTMAMEAAILRHVNAISDNVWEQELVPELKKILRKWCKSNDYGLWVYNVFI